jgi:hypothetical protein
VKIDLKDFIMTALVRCSSVDELQILKVFTSGN